MDYSGHSGDHSYCHIRIHRLTIMVLEEEKVIQRQPMILKLVVGIRREGYPNKAQILKSVVSRKIFVLYVP